MLVLTISSFGAAVFALWVLAHRGPKRAVALGPVSAVMNANAFLFDGETLIDATPAASELLDSGYPQLDDWPRLMSILAASFPNADTALATLETEGHLTLQAADGSLKLEAEWLHGITRLVIEPNRPVGESSTIAAPSPLIHELESLRHIVNDSPVLTWREDPKGSVIWANAAYISLITRVSDSAEGLTWPLPRLFDAHLGVSDLHSSSRRVSVRIPGQENIEWFECITHQIGPDALVFALPANRLVRAEASLREFIQTLTQTFAHLPTGLAVFDKNRRLALFNPALTDLSALQVDFLSAKPTLFAFLDRLREKQRMPEPKDYKTWRKNIVDLEKAAANGTYQETWSLPTGQTYRVTGRPHPGGAVALLFDDITAEISLTRRFRSELELGQSVIDSLDEAIAVFSPGGTLVMSNRRYQTLWNSNPSESLGDVSIVEVARTWQSKCFASPVWGDARNFVIEPGERADWSAEVVLLDQRTLHLRVVPIAGGATIISFASADGQNLDAAPTADALTA